MDFLDIPTKRTDRLASFSSGSNVAKRPFGIVITAEGALVGSILKYPLPPLTTSISVIVPVFKSMSLTIISAP